MRAIHSIGLSALILALAACNEPKPVATTLTDTDLRQTVEAKLATQSQLGDVRANADVEKNQITLTGTVETEQARMQAVDMAKASRANVSVVDKIDVKPREIARADYTEELAREAREKAKVMGDKLGPALDDAWIHTKLIAKFASNSDTPARKINIDVLNNVVTLRGEVDTQIAKDEAERVAKETDGVKRVINLLRIKPRG